MGTWGQMNVFSASLVVSQCIALSSGVGVKLKCFRLRNSNTWLGVSLKTTHAFMHAVVTCLSICNYNLIIMDLLPGF